MIIETIGGARYIYTIVDDYSRAGFVYLLKSKEAEENVQALSEFIDTTVRPTGKTVLKKQSHGKVFAKEWYFVSIHSYG
jgi:hypothetical protein